MKKILSLCLALSLAQLLTAQATTATDFFHNIGKIYVVVAVITIVFLGLAFFIIFLERRLAKVEQQLEEDA
ncbi:MAG: CcmD family protein [Bacteroidota bacterium]